MELKALSSRRSILSDGGRRHRAFSLHVLNLSPECIALGCPTRSVYPFVPAQRQHHTGINWRTVLYGSVYNYTVSHPCKDLDKYVYRHICVRINMYTYVFECSLSITEASLPGVQSKMLNVIIPPYRADSLQPGVKSCRISLNGTHGKVVPPAEIRLRCRHSDV